MRKSPPEGVDIGHQVINDVGREYSDDDIELKEMFKTPRIWTGVISE